MNVIDKFEGNNFFLSNFYISLVQYGDLMFTSSEAAFQSAKTLDLATKKMFCELQPHEAKKNG
jgi:hypothetical protein